MAPKQKLKKVSRKRREKKLVERGAAHIRSSFNNTIVTLTERSVLGQRRRTGFPWQQKVHSLRRTDGRRDRCQGCDGVWPEDRRSVCQGPRFRP